MISRQTPRRTFDAGLLTRALTCGLVWALAGSLGCGRNDAERGAVGPQALPRASNTEAQSSAPSPSVAQPVTPGPALALDTTLRILPDGIGLSIRNHGTEAVSLKRSVSLVRDGKTLEASALSLQLGCTVTACITLLPGTELLAPHWLDLPSAERCDAALLPPPAQSASLRLHACADERSQDIVLP